MTTLRDNFWIWGHDAGCHHRSTGNSANLYRLPGENRMGPLEGAHYLGIPNCCRVVFDGRPEPPFDAESERLRPFRRVVWSVIGDAGSRRNDEGGDDLEEVLRQAERYPNVVGGVLDDFFRPGTKDARMTPERLKVVRDRLHGAARPLELWIVYYAALLGIDYDVYLQQCDAVSFWSWTGADLAKAEERGHPPDHPRGDGIPACLVQASFPRKEDSGRHRLLQHGRGHRAGSAGNPETLARRTRR